MKRNFLCSLLAAALLPIAPVWAASSCRVNRRAEQDLSDIQHQAYQVGRQANGLEEDLRSGATDWIVVTGQTNMIADHVRDLSKDVHRFEAVEPNLNKTENRQLDRMETGLTTLKIFVNDTFNTMQPHRIIFERPALLNDVSAIMARAQIVHNTAKSMRSEMANS
jgi:septal ring factor EnvC (AmiA/AmiB activator)